MANANALQLFEEKEKKKQSWQNLSKTMEKVLHLHRPPNRIECLDISNISGKQAVGSLVCFTRGEADTGNFRHYKIKTVEGPNDYAMMKEVLERRLQRGMKENNLPDLFVVDGGKGQLGMALAVAGELGITEQIDWIGIAKEKQDEGEKLYKPDRKNPIILPHTTLSSSISCEYAMNPTAMALLFTENCAIKQLLPLSWIKSPVSVPKKRNSYYAIWAA